MSSSGRGLQHSPPAVISEIEELCREWLAPQVERLRLRQRFARPKVLNDPLWGSIRLYSWEVALLDSYLLQRLRFLKQLGVVHWVFPGAGHTRLEHTLGVVHQMQALLDGLERNSGLAGERIVDDVTTNLLRIAALVHDVGHSAMSHVSEFVIKDLPEIQELIQWTAREYHTRKLPSPSEAIAAACVCSPAFREFLSLRETGADFIRDVEEATTKIAGFILSGPVEPGQEFLSLLLNGAFDADKLDYMPRDCLMAGVPCALDVPRVVEKVHCVLVPGERVPESYRSWAQPIPDGRYRILALSRAGARALHEVAMTRSILFDKVYHHPKVRSLEATVRRLLQEMRDGSQLRTLSQWLNLVDEDLLRQDLPVANDLRSRNLLKRAFSITAPLDTEEGDGNFESTGEWEATTGPRGPTRQWRRIRDDYRKGVLSQKITALARDVSQELDLGEQVFSQPIEIDFPDVTRAGLDQFAFVGDGPDDLTRADAVLTGERPESAKRIARSHGHIFAPEATILPVFIASRLVLLRDYEQQYDATCYATTRLDLEEIHEAEARLEAKGFYEKAGVSRPESLAPARLRSHREMALENFLKTAWPRIEQLGITFGRYQSLGSLPVSPAGISAFLRQFETEGRARTALRVLEMTDFKDRQFFARSLESSVHRALQLHPVDFVCPLGSTGDSSALLYYLMNDLPQDLRRRVLPLELALEREYLEHILLWDDFCGTGLHTMTVLSQWLGLTDEKTLDEHLVDPLTSSRKERFEQTRISISYGLGMRRGLGAVQDFILRHKLSMVHIIEPEAIIAEDRGIFARNDVFRSSEERDDFQKFLAKHAREILEPNVFRSERPWNREKLENRLLGYGNTGQLLVFYYNVPAVTLTCLWASGEASEWAPLFPRRTKPSLSPAFSEIQGPVQTAD